MEEDFNTLKIAITGMACKFPGANNINEYWDNLINARESITTLTREELLKVNVDVDLIDNPNYVKAGAFIQDLKCFDYKFFNYSVNEASVIDPQQRLFLECVWHALEDACVKPGDKNNRIGVFAGCHSNSYLLHILTNPEVSKRVGELNVETGNEKDYLATRVSYKLDLRGPSMSVQSACSSSLVSVHLAVQSLLNGECDIAVAGGVSVSEFEQQGYQYQPGGIKSPDGHCRTFDQDSAGTVFGNGLGVVVLKRYEDAVSNGDNIYASIIGTAINNDGADKVGLTAPSLSGQRDAIEEAILVAGIEPYDLSYIECHGTATSLGDSIEISALKDVFSGYQQNGNRCGIGSVKTNIGHLNKASGIAGLIKAALIMKHKQIPPTLHFHKANPLLGLEDSPFYVVDQVVDLSEEKRVLRAGVSSFGVGGTNAHVVVEEANVLPSKKKEQKFYVLPYSAKTTDAVNRIEEQIHELLCKKEGPTLDELEYSLMGGRIAFPIRRFMIFDAQKQLVSSSKQFKKQIIPMNEERTSIATKGILFEGEIPNAYCNLKELLKEDPYCETILKPLLEEFDTLFGMDCLEAMDRLDFQKVKNQVCSYLLQTFVAKMLDEFAIKPEFIIGAWQGELAAAACAGIMSWKDGLLLLFVRNGVIEAASAKSVALSEAKCKLYLQQDMNENEGMDHTRIEYWLQQFDVESSVEDYVNRCIPVQHDDLLLLRVGAGEELFRDIQGRDIKVVNVYESENSQFLYQNFIGILWDSGIINDFDAYSKCHKSGFVPCTKYPFEKTECFIDMKYDFMNHHAKEIGIGSYLYVPTWQQARIKKLQTVQSDKCYLFLNEEDEWSQNLMETVKNNGAKTFSFQMIDSEEEIMNSNIPQKIETTQKMKEFFEEMKLKNCHPDYIVFSLIADTQNKQTNLMQHKKDILYSVLKMVVAYTKVFLKDTKLLLLTNNVESLVGESQENYYNSLLQGASIVIPQEFAKVNCFTVDIDENESPCDQIFSTRILDLLGGNYQDKHYIYRKQHLWKKAYEKVEDYEEVRNQTFSLNEGVYVITGGTGGIGTSLIKYLLNNYKLKIAVISRNPSKAEKILSQEMSSDQIQYFQADVTKEDEVIHVFQEIKQSMGEIKGIFHLAGVPGSGLIANKDQESLNKVLSPKVDGTLAIASALEDCQPDFILLFSSTIALKGGIGQVDYCAANLFMDHFASYQTQKGVRTISVNWDAWQDTGMTSGLEVEDGLTDEEAFHCLEYVLQSIDSPQIIVSKHELEEVLKEVRQDDEKKEVETKSILPENLTYEFVFHKLEEMICDILGEEEVDPELALEDVGIDSVLILQLNDEIETVFPSVFSVSKFYIYPSLNEIAEYIYDELTKDKVQPIEQELQEENDLDTYMKKIKENTMTIEEALQYLSKGGDVND